jgi:hypothetical protein
MPNTLNTYYYYYFLLAFFSHHSTLWCWRVPLLDTPLHIPPLPDDIHGEISLGRTTATIALNVAVIVTSPSVWRVGLDRHVDATRHVLGHQFQIVAGMGRFIVRLGQAVPLRASVGLEGVAVDFAAPRPADGDDGGAFWLRGGGLGSARGGRPGGLPEIADEGSLRGLV